MVVLAAYLGCTRLNFDLKFAPVIVYASRLSMIPMRHPTAVNSAAVVAVHAALLSFARIVFVVCYYYPYWLLNLDVSFVSANLVS